MIDILNSEDLTLEHCVKLAILAEEKSPCKQAFKPFLKAIELGDLEKARAIFNYEMFWLKCYNLVSPSISVNGRAVNYHTNGNKNVECFLKNGKKHGIYRSWYLNGALHTVSYFNEGKKLPNFESYDIWGERLNV